MKRKHLNDDDDDEILKDGERMFVPMRMMDGANARHPRIVDAAGNGDLGSLSRPGYRKVEDARSREAIEAAYFAYDQELQNAYRSADADDQLFGRDGDACMVDGSPGHLKRIGGKLVCVPDEQISDAGSAGPRRDARSIDQLTRERQVRMTEVYSSYDAALAVAYLDVEP
jgi:hypothetical protein